MGVLSLSATASAAAAAKPAIQFQQQSPLLIRGLLPATRRGGAFPISTRAKICFPQRPLLFSRDESCVESSSTIDELQEFRVVPSNVLTAETEEVKAVLTMLLRKQLGLSNEAAATMISKSIPFIDHLVARLRSIQKNRYLRRELTTLEIRDAIIPYIEYLCEDHGGSLDDVMEKFRNPPDEEPKDHRDSLVDVMENFPNPPEEEQTRHISDASPTILPLDSKKLKAMARMAEIGKDGQLPSNTLYLLDIGLDMDQIKGMVRKYPSFIYRSVEGKIKPLVEFLLDLGVPASNIPNILYQHPQLSGCRLSENIIPSMAYLETLGVDKSKWAKLIYSCPHLLTCSRQKVEATVDYLCELGLPRNRIGKVFTRCPEMLTYSIDDNLRPTTEYFRSVGVNLTSLLSHYPHVFGQSIECKLKPVTEFFLDKGYSIEEIGTMVSKYGSIYSLSLTKNLIPKWDFFVTMDYPRSALVKCPSYFGFSLEGRIKPRYSQVRKCGLKLSLSHLLAPSDSKFEKFLSRSMMKRLVSEHESINVTSDNIIK